MIPIIKIKIQQECERSAFEQKIKMIEQRLNEASCGEWRKGKGASIVSDYPASINGDDENAKYYGGCLIAESIAPENLDFIACAKSDITYLLDGINALIRENARIKGMLDLLGLQCPRCKNSEINPNDKFCKICGLPLSNH